MESFYIHIAPLRLGIVFAITPNLSKTGLNDAGIAMLNAFNYVAEAKNPYSGLSFITDVSEKALLKIIQMILRNLSKCRQ